MKLIKHVLNLLFLFTIPYIFTGISFLLTFGSFSYTDIVATTQWKTLFVFYYIIALIFYAASDTLELDLKLFKTN